MHVAICALRFFIVSGCILQFLDAAAGDEKLPFEVDVNSDAVDFGNVGLDQRVNAGNRLTWQASKQGENFVDSPKPASTQGFSFDEEPSSDAISPPSKVTEVPTHSITSSPKLTKKSSVSSAAGSKHRHSGSHSFWPHFHSSSSPSFGHVNPYGPGFPSRKSNPFKSNFPFGKSDPFGSNFPFGKPDPFGLNFPFGESDPFGSNFQFGKADPLDSFTFNEFDPMYSDFASATTNPSGFTFPAGDGRYFGPSAPFNDYGFPQPAMPPMMPSLSDMKLVEDRILDDENGKGRFRTYKSADGNAMVQLLRREGELASNSNQVGRFRQRGERRSFRRRPHFRRNAYKN